MLFDGDGQQTVLPYCIHPDNGGVYDFIEGHSFNDIELAYMPAWMERLMLAQKTKKENPQEIEGVDNRTD